MTDPVFGNGIEQRLEHLLTNGPRQGGWREGDLDDMILLIHEVKRLRDVKLKYDLDQAGIEQRDKEAIELVELRSEVKQLRAQLDRWYRALKVLPLKCPINGAGACREAGSCSECFDAWDGE